MKLPLAVGAPAQTFDFISHYVQMKRMNLVDIQLPYFNFISHYVQMKPSTAAGKMMLQLLFISHYVQMKRIMMIHNPWSI